MRGAGMASVMRASRPAAVFVSTCLVAGVGSLAMGYRANCRCAKSGSAVGTGS
ncbi:hypothetical protein LAD77_01780 [Klebsiella pneumoniae]|nr:hypothetical protein [Klebsiella pneumoniae]